MSAAVLSGLVAGYGIAIPVGAVGAYLVALTARTSWWVGACAALGIATADGLYALVAVVGGSAVAGVVEPVATPLRWVSALVLLGLAVRVAIGSLRGYRRGAAPVDSSSLSTGAPRAYARLLAVTLLNPATVVYFAALVLGGTAAATAPVPERVAFALAAFVASASWQLLLASGGALLGRVLAGDRGRLLTGLCASVVVAALAVRMVVTG